MQGIQTKQHNVHLEVSLPLVKVDCTSATLLHPVPGPEGKKPSCGRIRCGLTLSSRKDLTGKVEQASVDRPNQKQMFYVKALHMSILK